MRRVLALLTAALLLAPPLLAGSSGYRQTRKLALGGEGGWDYLTFDGEGRRLFVTRGTRVAVVDLSTGKEAGEISGTEGVHGVALATDLGRGFASNARANTVTIFDLKTLKRIADVKVPG